MLEARILEDLVKRALRIEQPSWYHFNEAEKLKIEGVYNMFTVSRALHRADVMAALRRFGCKVNTSQARFLIHEFDHDGKGVFSLSQFTSICARAQVVAAYEPPAGSESADTNVKQRGLSMIEVRALVDVFDEIDSRKNKSRKASPGEHFLFSDFANDGLIDKQQLVMAIKNGGYNPTLGEMNDYMNTFDPQDSG
jgi:Ca2+-binding EF-hand superfamily protein